MIVVVVSNTPQYLFLYYGIIGKFLQKTKPENVLQGKVHVFS